MRVIKRESKNGGFGGGWSRLQPIDIPRKIRGLSGTGGRLARSRPDTTGKLSAPVRRNLQEGFVFMAHHHRRPARVSARQYAAANPRPIRSGRSPSSFPLARAPPPRPPSPPWCPRRWQRTSARRVRLGQSSSPGIAWPHRDGASGRGGARRLYPGDDVTQGTHVFVFNCTRRCATIRKVAD